MSTIALPRATLFWLCLLGACEPQPPAGSSDREFFQCWHWVDAPSDLKQIEFRAAIYPREGVLAYNRDCPGLRLRMVFDEGPMPSGFDAFERADANRLEPVGIGGAALVSILRRESPDTLVVRVRRLVRGQVLSPTETARLLAEMRR